MLALLLVAASVGLSNLAAAIGIGFGGVTARTRVPGPAALLAQSPRYFTMGRETDPERRPPPLARMSRNRATGSGTPLSA